jgi:hypothetical protein
MPERAPWDPTEGESAKAYAAFELYRRLGPERTVAEAWRQYCTRPGTRRGHASTFTVPRVMPYFSKWAVRWRWRERALAWDAEQAEIERDQRLDRELQERAREHEEEIRQRQLMREEARAARALARRVLLRTLQTVEAGQLDQMNVTDLLPYLQKAATLLEVGQKLDRLYSGEPTDVTRRETVDAETVATLLTILQEFVPEERWGELAERLTGLDAAGPT